LKLAEDGEILARGANVFRGYHKDEAATREAFTADGWFQTGDIGRFEDGRLQITDRKRELFKTTGGKWVSPARIETALKRSIYLAQVVAYGDHRPHPCVLVAPNWSLLRTELELPDDVPTETLARHEGVRAVVIREVEAQTADLANYEQVRRVALLPRDLTIEDGELSPTLKVKRRVVEERYAALIAEAYAEDLHARDAARAPAATT
jgi:long-chain acyl-CoA synthetase